MLLLYLWQEEDMTHACRVRAPWLYFHLFESRRSPQSWNTCFTKHLTSSQNTDDKSLGKSFSWMMNSLLWKFSSCKRPQKPFGETDSESAGLGVHSYTGRDTQCKAWSESMNFFLSVKNLCSSEIFFPQISSWQLWDSHWWNFLCSLRWHSFCRVHPAGQGQCVACFWEQLSVW